MGVGKRLVALVFALTLASAVALSGCSAPAARPAAASLALRALAPSSASEAGDILEYLNATLDDFKVIDGLLADKDLALTEDDTSADEEMSMEDVAHYLELLGGYSAGIQDTLDAIEARSMPNHPELAKFRAAELAQFELAYDLIGEYIQVLNYIKTLLNMSSEIDKLQTVESDDPAAVYDSISQGIGRAIEEMKASNAPSFLKSMNDNMISSLTEMDDAVRYTLIAEQIDDPVRRDAAEYRMGILVRKFNKISGDAETDMDDRQGKLKDDLKNIQQLNNGLRKWVQGNIDKLSAD